MLKKYWRGFWLRCPRCGKGKLYAGYFSMREQCDACDLPFDRGPGFYLGAIYFNYGLTAFLVMAAYLLAFSFTQIDPNLLVGLLLAFCVLFPLWFFRHARGLWLAFDEHFDPVEKRES